MDTPPPIMLVSNNHVSFIMGNEKKLNIHMDKTRCLHAYSIVMEKYDGFHCIYDGCSVWTRNSSKLQLHSNLLSDLENALENVRKRGHGCSGIQFELVAKHSSLSDFYSVSKLLKSNPSNLQGFIFDAIMNIPFIDRLLALEEAIGTLQIPLNNIHMCSWRTWNTKDELETFVDNIFTRGGEGVVLGIPAGSYKDGRTDDKIKLKQQIVLDGMLGRMRGSDFEVIEEKSGKTFFIGKGLVKNKKIGEKVTITSLDILPNGRFRNPIVT